MFFTHSYWQYPLLVLWKWVVREGKNNYGTSASDHLYNLVNTTWPMRGVVVLDTVWSGLGRAICVAPYKCATQIAQPFASFPHTTQIISGSFASRPLASYRSPTQICASHPAQIAFSVLVNLIGHYFFTCTNLNLGKMIIFVSRELAQNIIAINTSVCTPNTIIVNNAGLTCDKNYVTWTLLI